MTCLVNWLGREAGSSSAISGYKKRGAAATKQARRIEQTEREAVAVQEEARKKIARLARRPPGDQVEAFTEAVLDGLHIALQLHQQDWMLEDIYRMEEGC